MDEVKTTNVPRRGGIPRGLARSGPAVLSYGFRPFFLGAATLALVAMSTWIGALTLGWTPGGTYGALNWHAHEMLFGYTSAALAGFMLTAIPNWTGRLPVSGRPLAFLVGLWLAGRLAMALAGIIGLPFAIAIDAAFLPALGFIAAREIGAGQNWRNLHVVFALAILTAANLFFHFGVLTGGDTGAAYRLAISAWLMLISLIGGRLAVSFTRNWLSRRGETVFPASFAVFDRLTILTTALTLLLWTVWPESPVTGGLSLAAAGLNTIRLSRWRGWKAWREPLVLILHIAYAFIPLGLTAIAAAAFGLMNEISALHLLTVGAIANMTLAVMTRVSRGHTGHQLKASRATTIAYTCLILSALIRPLVDWAPEYFLQVLTVSAVLWIATYALFLIEYGPMLIKPSGR